MIQNKQTSCISIIGKYYNKFLTFTEVVTDFLAIFLAFSISTAFYIFQHSELSYRPHFTFTALCTSIIGVIIFERLGLYQQQTSLMNLIEIRKIIRAISFLCLGLILYSYLQKINFPRTLLIYTTLSMLLFVLIERMLFFKLQQYLYIRNVNVRRVLILGAGEKGRLLFQNISQSPKLGYFVVGFLDNDQVRLQHTEKWFTGVPTHHLHYFNDYSRISTIIKTERIDEIFISNPLHSMAPINTEELARLCVESGVKLNFIPYMIQGPFMNNLQVSDLNGIPVVSYRPIILSPAEQLSKRLFDLILASIACLVLSPLFILISLLIHFDSQGPILFKQMRVGKDSAEFPIYKFRSMYIDTPQYSNSPKTSQDPRITPIGRFLRKTSLDELPQLFNVLRGEMSLVGPRPEMPFIVENEYNDFYRERLRVKPGITGVWQISGDRTREIHENISYDIFYIENRSLLLDIIILIRTLIFALSTMKTY